MVSRLVMRELYWVARAMFLLPSDWADHGQNKSSEYYIWEISFAHVQAVAQSCGTTGAQWVIATRSPWLSGKTNHFRKCR